MGVEATALVALDAQGTVWFETVVISIDSSCFYSFIIWNVVNDDHSGEYDLKLSWMPYPNPTSCVMKLSLLIDEHSTQHDEQAPHMPTRIYEGTALNFLALTCAIARS